MEPVLQRKNELQVAGHEAVFVTVRVSRR
jgi:hypothetical protein